MAASTTKTAYSFWADLGTMGVTAHLTSTATGPALDTATHARFRRESASGAVVHWDAEILGDPAATATTASIRHVFEAGDLPIGTYELFGQVSLDGGTTWYTQREPIALRVPK